MPDPPGADVTRWPPAGPQSSSHDPPLQQVRNPGRGKAWSCRPVARAPFERGGLSLIADSRAEASQGARRRQRGGPRWQTGELSPAQHASREGRVWRREGVRLEGVIAKRPVAACRIEQAERRAAGSRIAASPPGRRNGRRCATRRSRLVARAGTPRPRSCRRDRSRRRPRPRRAREAQLRCPPCRPRRAPDDAGPERWAPKPRPRGWRGSRDAGRGRRGGRRRSRAGRCPRPRTVSRAGPGGLQIADVRPDEDAVVPLSATVFFKCAPTAKTPPESFVHGNAGA